MKSHKDKRTVLGGLGVRLRPYRGKIALMALAFLVSTLCDLALPTVMSEIISRGVNGRDMNFIVAASGVMLGVCVLGVGSMVAAMYLLTFVVNRIHAELSREVFGRVHGMDYALFNSMGTGALITRSASDIEVIGMTLQMTLSSFISIPVMIVGGTALALWKDPYLALILFAFVPAIGAVVYFVSKKLRGLWKRSNEYIDRQNSLVRSRLIGIRVVRAFNREKTEEEKTAEATREMADNIIRANVRSGLISPVASLLLNLAIVAVIAVGAVRMTQSQLLTAGDVLAVIQYLLLIASGVVSVFWFLSMIPRLRVSVNRVDEIMTAPQIPPAEDLGKPPFRGEVRCEHLSLAYGEGAGEALSDLNFCVRAGEKVAFIGGTGAGKSTLVRLLIGLARPTRGELYFDGEDSALMSGQRIRSNVGCVLQRDMIFSDTLRGNVTAGREGISDEEVLSALKDAQILDFAQKNGLDYEIAQGGVNLSGGQKQRIAIARSLIGRSSVHIFDDSFSALDFLTEANMRRALSERLKGETQFVMTQRVSSAMSCDRIFVLDGGKIVGEGTHEELLRSCNIYREIYVSQTGGAL